MPSEVDIASINNYVSYLLRYAFCLAVQTLSTNYNCNKQFPVELMKPFVLLLRLPVLQMSWAKLSDSRGSWDER